MSQRRCSFATAAIVPLAPHIICVPTWNTAWFCHHTQSSEVTYVHTYIDTHIHSYTHIHMYIKVKWSRYSPNVAQRVGRGIALLFRDCGTRRGWVVSSTPCLHFTPRKDPVPILQEAGWAPGPVWTGGISHPHQDLIPDRPAHSSVAVPTELLSPHVCIYICRNTYIWMYVHTHIHTYMHACACTHIHVCT